MKSHARVLLPNRNRLELRASGLASSLPPGHRARRACGLCGASGYEGVPREHGGSGRGRAAIAPEILLVRWLYATVDGVGSDREIARLTAGCVNAQGRNRGLRQFRVRGLAKVKRVALFFVLAHNLMRRAELAPRLLGAGRGASPPFPEWAFEGERPSRKLAPQVTHLDYFVALLLRMTGLGTVVSG